MPASSQTLYITPVLTESGYRYNSDGVYPEVPSGYLILSPASKQYPMSVAAPRPDSETGGAFVADDFATIKDQHRWAYYDGVNPIRYEYSLKVRGGSAPFYYEIISAPAGATIVLALNENDDSILKWVPQAAFPAASPAVFHIRVHDQTEADPVDIEFTVQTTSSTNKFMFMSQSGNDSTGDGSYALPFATLFKFTGATTTTTTYPNRIVYMRGSETPYLTVAHTDAWDGGNDGDDGTNIESVPSRCHLYTAYHPTVYMSHPDEDVSIDFSGSQIEINGHGFVFAGSSTNPITILGSCDTAQETHNFWINQFNRVQLRFITFDGFIPRTNAGWTNSAPIFSSGTATPSNRSYLTLHGVHEINRTATSVNDALLHVLFGTEYAVIEYCTGVRPSGIGASFKERNYYTSVRYCHYDSGEGDGMGFAFMDQAGGGDNEIVYSRIKSMAWFNLQAAVSGVGKHFAGRCTVWTNNESYDYAWSSWSGDGPYILENCVLVSKGAELYKSAEITSTGNECHKTLTSGDVPINPVTLELVNATTAYRDLYLGIRGWEIQ